MKKFTIVVMLAFTFGSISAQQNNTDNSFRKADSKDSVINSIPDTHLQTKLLPSMIVPAALIVYGLTTLKNNGLYSSYQARADIQRTFGKDRSGIDNFLQFAP